MGDEIGDRERQHILSTIGNDFFVYAVGGSHGLYFWVAADPTVFGGEKETGGAAVFANGGGIWDGNGNNFGVDVWGSIKIALRVC